MFQTTSCGYSKLVSWEAWYNAKGISLIQASCAEKTPKMSLKIDFFKDSPPPPWGTLRTHFWEKLKNKIEIFRDILGVFSAQDAWIKLIPFALYQASQDTSLEYPHGVV